MTARPLSLNLTNLLLLAALFIVSLSVGVADFRWSDVFSLSDSTELILVSRLPRTFAIVLTGASMAVAGMIMQILMRNRFVEPSMVGASQSAALGVLVMTLMFPAAGLMVPLVGIIFGGVIEAVTTFITYEFIPIVNIT